MKFSTPDEAAARFHPEDSFAMPLGPGQPVRLLEAMGKRDDWTDLRVFSALLVGLFQLFGRPGVHLRSGFFGPAERALRAAGHDVQFVPADFRRFEHIGRNFNARVIATSAALPDASGHLSLSLHAGATVAELQRAARDPERLLMVEASPHYPRTLGLPPDHPHRLHVDDIDVLIESDAAPLELPDAPPSATECAIADHIRPYVPEGATLQTGIGGVPNAVVSQLAEGSGGGYGVHSEMFTSGLMQLHRAGKVTNRKGFFDGASITTFALGNRELYDWLDQQEAVRFVPVDVVNDPGVIARNPNMISINGALAVDLYGQIVADTIEGKQYSGIGGHEDFLAGTGMQGDDRSLLCLPSSVEREGARLPRIVPKLPAGSIVTSPRHQVSVIVTEYGAAELAGLSVEERARALAAVAHPDDRPELEEAAARLAKLR